MVWVVLAAGCADPATCLGNVCFSSERPPPDLPSDAKPVIASPSPLSGRHQLSVQDGKLLLAFLDSHGPLAGAIIEVDRADRRISTIYSQPGTTGMFPIYMDGGMPIFQVAEGIFPELGSSRIWSKDGPLFPDVNENHWVVDWGDRILWSRESEPAALHVYAPATGERHTVHVPPHAGWDPANGSIVSRFAKLVGREVWVVVETPGDQEPHAIVAFDPATAANRTVYASAEFFVDFLEGDGNLLLAGPGQARLVDGRTGDELRLVSSLGRAESITCDDALTTCVFFEVSDEGRRLAWVAPSGPGYLVTREDYRMYDLDGTTLYFGDPTGGWRIYALELGYVRTESLMSMRAGKWKSTRECPDDRS
jgi:hypothetical protein